MKINQTVIDKIKEEEKKWGNNEFGGYLIVNEKDEIEDVIFDVAFSDPAYVRFGVSNLPSVPREKRPFVRGWFHKHPINGLSGMDKDTICQLTKFFNVCYSVVLQANDNLLLTKHMLGLPMYPMFLIPVKQIFEVYKEEIPFERDLPEPIRDYIDREL